MSWRSLSSLYSLSYAQSEWPISCGATAAWNGLLQMLPLFLLWLFSALCCSTVTVSQHWTHWNERQDFDVWSGLNEAKRRPAGYRCWRSVSVKKTHCGPSCVRSSSSRYHGDSATSLEISSRLLRTWTTKVGTWTFTGQPCVEHNKRNKQVDVNFDLWPSHVVPLIKNLLCSGVNLFARPRDPLSCRDRQKDRQAREWQQGQEHHHTWPSVISDDDEGGC